MLLVVLTTVSFYFITVYTPDFGKSLQSSASDALLVTLLVALANFCWLPIGGALSDRLGRKPVLLAAAALMLVSAYPALTWLAAAPSFGKLIAVEMVFSLGYGVYNGAMVAALTEVVPAACARLVFRARLFARRRAVRHLDAADIQDDHRPDRRPRRARVLADAGRGGVHFRRVVALQPRRDAAAAVSARSGGLCSAQCHPRERKDPERHERVGGSRAAGADSRVVACWIPAFAGMTGVSPQAAAITPPRRSGGGEEPAAIRWGRVGAYSLG